jgi:hypothetical protein
MPSRTRARLTPSLPAFKTRAEAVAWGSRPGRTLGDARRLKRAWGIESPEISESARKVAAMMSDGFEATAAMKLKRMMDGSPEAAEALMPAVMKLKRLIDASNEHSVVQPFATRCAELNREYAEAVKREGRRRPVACGMPPQRARSRLGGGRPSCKAATRATTRSSSSSGGSDPEQPSEPEAELRSRPATYSFACLSTGGHE